MIIRVLKLFHLLALQKLPRSFINEQHKNSKRALALGGAKNHLMVLPDAKADMTAQNVAASMSGCAGQRCMAASAMVGVGNIDHIIEKIC